MSEYRLAPGWVNYTTLTTTDAYAVANFPVSGDYSKPWRVATDGVVTAAAFPATLSGKVYQVGGLATAWDFGLTTPARYGWFRDTYPVGGKVTYMTQRLNWDSETGDGTGWIAVQGYMQLLGGIQPDATANANDLYIISVRLVLNRGTLLSPP